jgi:hypothetical protein
MKQYIYKTTHCASYVPIILHVAIYVEHETFTFLLSFFFFCVCVWMVMNTTLHIVFFWVAMMCSVVGGNMLLPFLGIKD